MTPILASCFISHLFSYCTLENGSLYTAFRVNDALMVYIDGEHYQTIKEGKVI